MPTIERSRAPGRVPGGIVATVLACAIAGAAGQGARAYGRHPADHHQAFVTTRDVPFRDETLTLQRAALANRHVLPIYGSSELFCCPTLVFAPRPTGSPGRAGMGDLFFAQTSTALGHDLRHEPVVVSDSPSRRRNRSGPSPTPAAVPRDIHAGVRVRLEGTMTGSRTVVADGVEIVPGAEGEDGLKAVIETVDPEAKTLTALGIKIVASDAMVLRGESHEPVSFSAIRPGQRVSAKGTFRGDPTLVASKLRIRPEKPEKARDVTLEGPVQQADSETTSFAVLGVTVMLTPQTKIERGARGREPLAGRVVTGAPRGEAPPSIPSYGVIWEKRLTRSGEPRDEAGWTWLRTHGVLSVVNFRVLREDEGASERARFEHYLSLPFSDKAHPTDAEAETFLAFVQDPRHWPVHIHCKQGRYRTGLMAALVRYAIDGWSIDEALAEARRYTGGKDLYAPAVHWLRRWAANHEPGSHARSRNAKAQGPGRLIVRSNVSTRPPAPPRLRA